MSACVKKLKIYERDGSSSSTLRGRGNSRSQKRKIPVDNAIRGYILSSDGKRDKWHIEGPLFAGCTVYHMKRSPIDPNRIYASQCSDWFGQVIQRSNDSGQTREQPGGEPAPDFTGQPPAASNKFVTKATPELLCGTTARHIPGNLSESGISNLH